MLNMFLILVIIFCGGLIGGMNISADTFALSLAILTLAFVFVCKDD